MSELSQAKINSFATTLAQANEEEGHHGVAIFLRNYASGLLDADSTGRTQMLDGALIEVLIQGVTVRNRNGDAIAPYLYQMAGQIEQQADLDSQLPTRSSPY